MEIFITGRTQSCIFNQNDEAFVSGREIHTLRPRQNDRHFPDDIFKRIFFNENIRILIKISLKFVP